tara:strand:+ start:38530 stop:39399 length:870 start_codon:yes stop_codon:yes gene_type:complete
MIDFRKVGKIVVHPGGAHRDDFLFVCFVLAMCKEQGVVPVVHRRDPTEEELRNPYVVVGDVGERHEPELSNFDHHQFDRDHAPTCALTLLLKDMTIYEESLRGFRWLDSTEKFDSKGPFFVANEIGVEWNKISDVTFSPIEETILHMFSKLTELNETMIELMTSIGSELLNTLELFTNRWEELSKTVVSSKALGNEVVFSVEIQGNEDPAFALSAYVEEKHPNAVVTITNDDRGDGLCLFRLNDSPKIDFSQIENDDRVLFAHKNGFVAKTHEKISMEEVIDLIEKSTK